MAVAGSPGLRSIGSLVINSLIQKVKPELIAELHSTHFPLIYQTKPSYASHPRLPGIGGITIESGVAEFPRIQFYFHPSPPLIITQGCHANFNGQYEVAEKVLDFYKDLRVKRLIVVAGYGLKGADVCCAATNPKLMDELKHKYGVEVGYEGPFYGFSGLVFGLAQLKSIDALCLFGRTEPTPDFPESPDEEAATTLLNKLTQILNLTLDT
ncbi:MAG: PAC2 family protein [Candidatus Bathyarchaeota archaeon]|nr:PAC2 family protein [Candidatus Bathyarchaeota archaeon]